MTGRTFSSDFLWGVATAGHQNEGDNVDSDTWFVERVTPTVFSEVSGKAANGWELWASDLDLAAEMGMNAYRFSIEWARIEPDEGTFVPEALDHYEAMVDGCLVRGLAPIVTFNHFTSPHWFAKQSAWLDDDAPEHFARYCDAVMTRFGDRIAFAVTLNEPNLPRLLSWILPQEAVEMQRATLAAASRAADVPRYRLGNVVQPEDFDAMEDGLTRAHIAAKRAIKAVRANIPVGLSIAVIDDVADGDTTIRDRKRADCYEHWLHLAQVDDFVGVQNYERVHYGAEGVLPVPEGAVVNEMGSAVDPASLGGAVRYAYEIAHVPIIVTEHGVATSDDAIRSDLLEPALEGLLTAIDDGVPVIGYCHWTLIDNFEWVAGFSSYLGLHSLNRNTFERTPKPSAEELRRLIAHYRERAGHSSIETVRRTTPAK